MALATPPTPVDSRRIQVLELTAKRWKRLQLVGALALLFSPLMCIASSHEHDPDGVHAGGLIFLGGLGLWLWGRIGAWWHHK